MKHYIVQNQCELPLSYGEWYLTKAKNKQDAVDRVYNIHGYDYKKKDFKAFSLEEICELEDVIML